MFVATKLAKLVGQRIVRASRLSYAPAEKAYEKLHEDYGIARSDLFADTDGGLDLWFEDGKGLGILSDDSAMSLHVDRLHPGDLPGDDEYPIECDDPVYSNDYWRQLKGAVVRDIIVHRGSMKISRSEGRPNQRGLSFKLDNGLWFAVAYWLRKNQGVETSLCTHEELLKYQQHNLAESMSVTDPAATTTDWGTY